MRNEPFNRATVRRRAVVVGLCAASFSAGAITASEGATRLEAQSALVVAVERMGADRLAGQRIVTGFGGEAVPRRLRRAIARGRIAGVVLFSENFDSAAEAEELISELQAIDRPRDDPPLLVMVDQEGGQVKRFGFAPSLSAEEMGKRGPRSARRQGAATADGLRGVGVSVDLAPVLDVARPGSAIDLEGRAFGADPATVSDVGGAFAAALARGGIAATAKHFPGFGAAGTNTDFAAQTIDLSRRRLRNFDERPYRRFIRDGGSLVMLSMAVYPAFDDLPASLSKTLATEELRERLEFEGVSATDALDTPAGDAVGSTAEVALLAAGAGTDLLLYAGLGAALDAHRALAHGLRGGRLDRDWFEDSVARVLRLRGQLGARTG